MVLVIISLVLAMVLVIIILRSPGAGLRCGLLGFLIMPEGEGCRGREPGPLSTSSYTLCCKIYKTARKKTMLSKTSNASTGAWASLNVILHSPALVLLQNIQNRERKTMLSKHWLFWQNLSMIIVILSLSLTLSSLSAILQDNLQKRNRSSSKFVICNKSRSKTTIFICKHSV